MVTKKGRSIGFHGVYNWWTEDKVQMSSLY